jgi:hypothetical protein
LAAFFQLRLFWENPQQANAVLQKQVWSLGDLGIQFGRI